MPALLGKKLKQVAARERALSVERSQQKSLAKSTEPPDSPSKKGDSPVREKGKNSFIPSPVGSQEIKASALKKAAVEATRYAAEHPQGSRSAFPGHLAAKAKAVKDALKAASGELEVTTNGPYTDRIRIRIEYLSLVEGVRSAA